MAYLTEAEMYPDVVVWLENFLKQRYRRRKIIVRDTSRFPLKQVFQSEGLVPSNKPDWLTYDIRVDVTGFVISGSELELAFIECKNTTIGLKDIAQLLGYSRVALPIYSCIMSPLGPSGDIVSLLRSYNRCDVLEYNWPPGKLAWSIQVAYWDRARLDIDRTRLIPASHPLDGFTG